MRTSLRKLRGFGLHQRHDSRDRNDNRPSCFDELDRASQDMLDMRDCYDSLLSAAAATANSAYEFSESLRDLGACLLEKTALSNDEETGKVLLMLGKVQFELQKLIDSYRSHIVQTITIPSESILNELRTVEEMKQQCDEKRSIYESMITRHREKGRSRSVKGESISSQQLQQAHDAYDEESTLFVFRLKSLRQGQSRILLTQAARHHAAQLCFFRKALKSLEEVEPRVKVVTEQQHIDYHFTGLEEDDGEDGDDDVDGIDGDDDNDDVDDGFGAHDGKELSFDYGQNNHGQDANSSSRNLMESDPGDLTFPQVATADSVKEYPGKRQSISDVFGKDFKLGSQSAPLFAEKKLDPAESISLVQPSPRKFHAYVLPTPDDTKSSFPAGKGNSSARKNLWHSYPLEAKKHETSLRDKNVSGLSVVSAGTMLKESNNNVVSAQLPPPLLEGRSLPLLNQTSPSYSKKIKRQAFSGPLTRSTKHSSGNSPVASTKQPQLFSGPLLHNTAPTSSSPKVSPSTSPSFGHSPKISELHELPRPPANSANSARSSGLLGYSAPLLSSNNLLPLANRLSTSSAASPLPQPPQSLHRSFSIPTSSQRMVAFQVSQPLEEPNNVKKDEEIVSRPLKPISLPNQLSSTTSVTVIPACEIGGAN